MKTLKLKPIKKSKTKFGLFIFQSKGDQYLINASTFSKIIMQHINSSIKSGEPFELFYNPKIELANFEWLYKKDEKHGKTKKR